jgi:hypothetical protein
MNLLAAFRRFWYHDTIDAMQAKMLRKVLDRQRRLHPRSIFLSPELFAIQRDWVWTYHTRTGEI